MSVVWVRRTSNALLGAGFVLVLIGLSARPFGAGHSVLAGAPTASAVSDRTNPDEVLHDEALEIRRRVAEYRLRATSAAPGWNSKDYCVLCGCLLAIGGAVGRFTSRRRELDVHSA